MFLTGNNPVIVSFFYGRNYLCHNFGSRMAGMGDKLSGTILTFCK